MEIKIWPVPVQRCFSALVGILPGEKKNWASSCRELNPDPLGDSEIYRGCLTIILHEPRRMLAETRKSLRI